MMAPLTTATLPLHNWRMRASFFRERWRRRSFPGSWLQPVDFQRARLRATVETNAATGAAFPRVEHRHIARDCVVFGGRGHCDDGLAVLGPRSAAQEVHLPANSTVEVLPN